MSSGGIGSPDYGKPTVMHLLRARAAAAPDFPVFTYLVDGDTQEERLCYGDLDRQARAIAVALRERLSPGDRALLLYAPGLDYLAAYYGCLYAGVIAVPAYPPDPARLQRTVPRLVGIIGDAHVAAVVSTAKISAMAGALRTMAPALGELHWIASDTLPEGTESSWRQPDIGPDTVAFLQYTSGSTGDPRGVQVTHSNLRANARVVELGVPPHEQSVVVNWAPMYHDLGLVGLGVICPVFFQVPVVMMSPLHFLRRPISWLRAVTRYRATNCGAPDFAYARCVERISPKQCEGLDLSSWEVALNGAEPVRASTIERFSNAFAPYGFRREAFYPSYGLAEATLMVTGGRKLSPPVIRHFDSGGLERGEALPVASDAPGARALVSCGQPIDGQVRIVDPDTCCAIPLRRVGEVWVQGESVARGYYGRRDETERTFHAHLADTGDGPLLRTGDLGFFDGDDLFIVGRIKDMVIVRGRKFAAQDIEAAAESCHPQIRTGCSAAFSVPDDERVVLVAEMDPGEDEPEALAEKIRIALASQQGLHIDDVVLIEPRSIWKTSSGKIQRSATRVAYLEDTLQRI